MRSPTETPWVRVHHPDIEGQFFEQAFRHHVVRMVVGVDEPWDDELAGGVENFNLTVGLKVGRDAFNYPTVDQKIGGLGLMYVAVMVIDPAPEDQIALGPCFPRHEWPLFSAICLGCWLCVS